MMRILSIDLPWSAAMGWYGFAWIDPDSSSLTVNTTVVAGPAAHARQIFQDFASEHGRFDLILIDQPIGACLPGSTGCRDVEKAFGNSAFVMNGDIRLQAPRFQPGAPYADLGLRNAGIAIDHLGTLACVVVESFPQLSVLPLIAYARAQNLAIDAVNKLGRHKARGPLALRAAQQLLATFRQWTRTTVTGPASSGQADALDAMLALLPALEVALPSGQTIAAPVWLHASGPNGVVHPSSLPAKLRASARAAWMSPLLTKQLGPSGIRSDGLFGITLPGWLPAAGPMRAL